MKVSNYWVKALYMILVLYYFKLTRSYFGNFVPYFLPIDLVSFVIEVAPKLL